MDKGKKDKDDLGNAEELRGVNDMDTTVDRYCTVAESLEESLKEMKLIRQGKLPKKSWRDLFSEIQIEDKENQE